MQPTIPLIQGDMKEKRRENRLACDLPISVLLRDGFAGPVLAGPSPARLHDVSTYGASLIIPQIRFGNHHLFYSSRDHHPSQVLFIEAPAGEGSEPFLIPVRPIGFDRVLCDETMPFHIGVEFMADADSLQIAQLKKMAQQRRRGERKSWWKEMLRKIWPSLDAEDDS